MPNSNDPNLTLLLKGVSDSSQREAIIAAHTNLVAGGPSSLPGAMGILLARLVAVVVEVSVAVAPSTEYQQQIVALRGEITRLRKDDIPSITIAKDTMIAANLNTRRLRMTYVMLWIILIGILSAGAGGYVVYRYTALTPRQLSWIDIGAKMSRHRIGVIPAEDEDGTYGFVIGGPQPVEKATFVKENGENAAVEIRWRNEDGQ